MNQVEGDLIATELKVAFVVSRFNEFVCERLLDGAIDTFVRHNGNKDNVTVLRVPGAFELPLVAKKVANSGCNGVIVGSTFVKYIQDNLSAPDLTQSFGKQVKSFSEVLK